MLANLSTIPGDGLIVGRTDPDSRQSRLSIYQNRVRAFRRELLGLRRQPTMKTDGQEFLEQLESFAPNKFATRFSKHCTKLGLGAALDANELNLLYKAAFRATLCNIAINGLGGCEGKVKPEREVNRTRLEWQFMAARDQLYASRGWQLLSLAEKGSVGRVFLNVFVADYNLA